MGEGLEFGVDWYPEQWERRAWERDADRMRAMGLRVVRLMEFAWPLVEPEPGSFDFGLFEDAVSLLASRGIRVILGTPTAAMPAWLAEAPGVLQTAPDGRVRDFGTRRMACLNSPSWRVAARRVAAACAERFGQDPRVIGWQVDNEIGHEGSDRCVCPNCRSAWHAWLERRYGSPAAMNEAWGAVFWGASVTRFDQASVPRRQVASTFNPSLLLDYDRFMSDSVADFTREQVAILRERSRPECFVTTNLCAHPLSIALDHEDLGAGMDFASWDNYPCWGPQDEPSPWWIQAYEQSVVRGIGGYGPFTVMEAFSGFQGHACLGHLPPAEQVALWAAQAVARGAERFLWFRWRTAPFGQEQLCYGLFDTDDRPTERSRAIGAFVKAARDAFSPFASRPVESDVCLLWSKDDARVLREQHLSEGLHWETSDWSQAGYDRELAKWFAPYARLGVNADCRSVRSADLDRYRVVSLPLYQMAEPAFVSRLDEWVRRGGVLVLGYRAGARDMRNWNVPEPLPGLFEEMAGLRVPRFESLNAGKVGIRVLAGPLAPLGGARGSAGVWADLVEPVSATPVAFYADRRKHYDGLPCATFKDHGRGRVWYIGTSPDEGAADLLHARILREAGLDPRRRGDGIEVVERRSADEATVKVVLNHTGRARRVLGRKIAPWGWAVVE